MKHLLEPFARRAIPRKLYPRLRDTYSAIRYWLLFPLYVGDDYECPLCQGRFRRFLPGGADLPVFKEKNVVGAGYRPNVVCPRCRSTDRERHLYLYLKKKTNIFNAKLRVLHFAPERNLRKVLMSSPGIEYVCADLNSPLAMVRMDISNIACGDESFDVIICSHVLEYVEDDGKAISELCRVLRRDGWAIVQVPVSHSLRKSYEDPSALTPEEREKVFGQRDNVRIYGKDYVDRLRSAGFSVEPQSLSEELGDLEAQKSGLLMGEYIYLCRKSKRDETGA